ncbi:hypothetical protein [Cellulomonas sp. URHE0023]|uniref:hypothetical protein n=1 Tax=Cellulomonas sp. URHE0023 TaxID=1380354 RepID=UPI0004823C83|nr:hypothetical protein [Cellulomonas sp. URHE0023]
MHGRAAGLAVGLIILTGCTAGSDDDGSPSVTATPTAGAAPAAPELLWSAQDVTILSEPKLAGDVAVTYVTDGEDLRLRAWDLTSGDQLWDEPASPGGGAPGVQLSVVTLPVADRTYTAVQSMAPDGRHTLKVLDVATGQAVTLANQVSTAPELAYFSQSRIWRCEDEQAFCLQAAVTAGGAGLVTLRVDPGAATVVGYSEGAEIPANSRKVSDLWSSNDRPPGGTEVLGRSQDGQVVWSHGYAELLGPDVSSDAGWNWTIDDGDRVLGTVRAWQGISDTSDRTRESTVALDGATGNVLWRADGATTFCEPAGDFEVSHLWCRVRAGTIDWSGEAGPVPVGATDIDLEKFDPATGEVVWSAPLGDAPGVLYAGLQYASGTDSGVFASGTGAVRVQLDDGSVSPVGDDEVLACTEETSFQFAEFADPSRARVEYPGGTMAEFCLPDGTRVEPADVTAQAVRDAGVDAGNGIWVVATTDGLQGYRLRG